MTHTLPTGLYTRWVIVGETVWCCYDTRMTFMDACREVGAALVCAVPTPWVAIVRA